VPDPTDTRAKIVRLNKRAGRYGRLAPLYARSFKALAKNALGEKRVAALRRDLRQLVALLDEARRK
jgi:hypothetical protein